MAFWDSKSFRALNKLWREKLKESDFEDIEDEKGNLSQKNHRTKAFLAKEETIEFYSILSNYIQTKTNIKPRDRQILELYLDGERIKAIAIKTEWSTRTVNNVLKLHKSIMLKKQ